MRSGPEPDRYAVIGNPVGHSQSPRIHALFAAQTAQALRYEAILAPLDDFADALHAFAAAGGRGVNITLPFKEQACRLATRLSPRAQAAGAVNTLLLDADGIFGDNTDGAGLVRDVTHNLGRSIARQRLLLLGAGGAARGVLLPLLLELPAQLLIANRSKQKAQQLVEEFSKQIPPAGLRACGLNELAGQSFDLVINATSAGLSGISLDIPAGLFAPGCLAYDMVYGKDTPFMAQARQAGAQVADGLGMLVEQAAESFHLWREVRPDTAPVLRQLRELRGI
ncbi:MAG: shikimate dehydrogenase [Betaproteobacteria bacterium]|nr:shikimate dehydrogenase [Betaproteobacteria bacterium]